MWLLDGGEVKLEHTLDEIALEQTVTEDGVGTFLPIPPHLERVTITPTEQAQTVFPGAGFEGISQADVSAIPDDYVGSSIPRNPNLSVSGKTVTAPSGYYSSSQSASVATGSAQTPTTRIDLRLKMEVEEKSATVIARGSADETVTPVVNPGWVQNGTAGQISVDAFGEMELPLAKVQDKIILNEKKQTVATAPGWISNDIVIPGIDSQYVGSDVPRLSSADLTVNGRTVTAPAGFYSAPASQSVAQGTAGTPVASKGTVSNHAVQITPRVSNTTGYINGGTVKGTPVHVDASELVSGSQTVTQNGTVNVTNLAEVVVDVPLPEGEFEYVDTLYEDVIDLDDTTFSTWTASSTAGSILVSENKATFVADLDTYVYYLVWEVCTNFAYLEGATLKAMPITEVAVLPQAIVRRTASLANAQAHNNTTTACLTDTTSTMLVYYTTGGVATYVANNTYGIYPSATAATFSSTTSKAPTVTVKSPTMNARCSSTYFATARKPEVDTANTKIHRRCKLYRMHPDKFGRQWEYDTLINFYNAKRTQ